MKVIEESRIVLYSCSDISEISDDDIELLKSRATAHPDRKARLCAHRSVEDALHEMIIVHASGAYIRPHRHRRKTESFHVVEGELLVVIFEEDGQVRRSIEMAPPGSGKAFYYRLNESLFHTALPISDWIVFHEVTNGPFDRTETEFADWAPIEQDRQGAKDYLRHLQNEIRNRRVPTA